jgi:hypothetical protein
VIESDLLENVELSLLAIWGCFFFLFLKKKSTKMSITPLKKQVNNLRMQKSVSIVDVLRQAQIHLHGHGHSGTATDNQEGNHLLAERLLSPDHSFFLLHHSSCTTHPPGSISHLCLLSVINAAENLRGEVSTCTTTKSDLRHLLSPSRYQ